MLNAYLKLSLRSQGDVGGGTFLEGRFGGGGVGAVEFRMPGSIINFEFLV